MTSIPLLLNGRQMRPREKYSPELKKKSDMFTLDGSGSQESGGPFDIGVSEKIAW